NTRVVAVLGGVGYNEKKTTAQIHERNRRFDVNIERSEASVVGQRDPRVIEYTPSSALTQSHRDQAIKSDPRHISRKCSVECERVDLHRRRFQDAGQSFLSIQGYSQMTREAVARTTRNYSEWYGGSYECTRNLVHRTIAASCYNDGIAITNSLTGKVSRMTWRLSVGKRERCISIVKNARGKRFKISGSAGAGPPVSDDQDFMPEHLLPGLLRHFAFDVFDGFSKGLQLFRIVVGDADVEGLLEL